MHHYQRGRASITGLVLKLRESNETGRLVAVVMTRLVCAQHGHVVNGVQVPCGNTRHEKMKKPPSEANSGAGDRSGEGRLGENRELMDKNRIEPLPPNLWVKPGPSHRDAA